MTGAAGREREKSIRQEEEREKTVCRIRPRGRGSTAQYFLGRRRRRLPFLFSFPQFPIYLLVSLAWRTPERRRMEKGKGGGGKRFVLWTTELRTNGGAAKEGGNFHSIQFTQFSLSPSLSLSPAAKEEERPSSPVSENKGGTTQEKTIEISPPLLFSPNEKEAVPKRGKGGQKQKGIGVQMPRSVGRSAPPKKTD